MLRARKCNLRHRETWFLNRTFLLQDIDVAGFLFFEEKKSTFASNKQNLNMYVRIENR